jgi:hypothetical protein
MNLVATRFVNRQHRELELKADSSTPSFSTKLRQSNAGILPHQYDQYAISTSLSYKMA